MQQLQPVWTQPLFNILDKRLRIYITVEQVNFIGMHSDQSE